MTEIAVYDDRNPTIVQQQQHMQTMAVQRLGEWAQSAIAAHEVASSLVQTSFVPQAFRDKPHEATAAILAGAEVGLSPMASLRSFDVIGGTAAPRAMTLRAIVQSQGHEMILVESTATRCKMRGKRRGSVEWQEVAWTIERARDLSLLSKDNWKKQPAAMLVARATSELARLIAADAILGIGYTVEELDDGADPQSEPTISVEAGPTRRMSLASIAPPETDSGADVAEGSTAPESPYLNTSSGLAKRMFALFGEIGISDRDKRLERVSTIVGRPIESSSKMTDQDAEKVIAALEADLASPFGNEPPLEGDS